MKSLSAFNEAAIDSPHVAPILLLEIAFSGLTLYLCNTVWGDAGSRCVFNGQVYEPLILNWDTVKCGKLDPLTYKPEAGEFAVTLMNDMPVGGADSFSALMADYDIHFAVFTASLIFDGASAAGDKIDIFKGQIEDVLNALTDQITLVMSGYELSLSTKFSHDMVTADDYPGADPDDLGKMLPQVYGRANKVPFMAVDAGAISTLASDITSSTTTLTLTDSSRFPSSGTVQIGQEKITYTGNSGNQLTGCTRGASGTTAVEHKAGAGAAEIKTNYFFIIGHAVKAIDNVYVANVRQSANYTAYTGQSGDEHADYPGKACIAFTADQVVKKLVHDISGRGDHTCNLANGDVPYTHEGSAGWHNIYRSYSGYGGNYTPSFDGTKNNDGFTVTIHWEVVINSLGTTSYIEFYADDPFESNNYANLIFKVENGAITDEYPHPWIYHTTNDEPQTYMRIKMVSPSAWDGDVDVIINAIEITLHGYEQTTSGEVAFSGNSVADTVIGGRVCADVQGYQDDASGTYTGTPNALIEQPDHIAKHIIMDRCGLTASEIDATAYAAAATYYAANSFRLAVVILQRPDVRMLLTRIAHQARSIECWEAGKHRLIPIPDTIAEDSVDKSLEANRIDLGQIWVRYTNRAGIKNTLVSRYARDWSGYSDNVEADRAVVTAVKASSVSRYGTLEDGRRSMPYVIDQAQAENVLGWEIEEEAHPKLLVELVGGYWLTDIERGDVVDFSFTAGDYLDKALLRLVGSEGHQFRIIDKTYRNDGAVQIHGKEIPCIYGSIQVLHAGSKTIAAGATKYLHLDSGVRSAQILGVVIKGVVGADWTVGVYVPADDGAAKTQAADKRNEYAWESADTEAGRLEGFGVPYDCCLDFTNDSGASNAIEDVVVVYRSNGALSAAWEA